MASLVINVKGMSCNHCKMAVEKSLRNLAGVENAAVDLGAANVTVTYEDAKVSVDQMKKAIEDAGYEPA